MTTIGEAQSWNERLVAWRERLKHYKEPPDEAAIDAWFARFDEADRPVAAKVLDRVKVVGHAEIMQGYHDALKALPGWDPDETKWTGRWFFVGFGGPHESGAAMVRPFCEANAMAYGKFNKRFVSLSDLPRLRLEAKDHVVFIDDFSGSGRQVTRMWPKISELVASDATCYLILTALTRQAQQAIEEATELQIVAQYVLGPNDALFDPENDEFSANEKARIEYYCAIAEPRSPKGFGGLGVMYVLHHKAANNCLPILYVNDDHWRGLLPRYWRAA